MNGYTPTTPVRKQIANLAEQIPQEHRAATIAMAMPDDGNEHTLCRNLAGLVIGKAWSILDEHPVDEAQRIEREIDAVLAPMVENNKTEREKFIDAVAEHNSKVKQWVKKENCQHEKTYAVISGIFCRDCHETIEPRNDFEKRLVSRLNYKGNGYVNYQFRP